MKFNAPEHVHECTQWIDRPVEEVFAFFSAEENLERLTPPWLGFHVLQKSTPKIQAGTLIDYRLKISGVPVRWRTLIESWNPGISFVDTQLSGPYKKWHHTHTFSAEKGGTRMNDRVVFALPLGKLGDLVASWKVKRQVRDIFRYRESAIQEIFPPKKVAPRSRA